MDYLTKGTITIDINKDGEYSVDFRGVPLTIAYVILKKVVDEFESGSLFDHGASGEDSNGEPLSPDDLRSIIRELKATIDSDRDPGEEDPLH